MAEIPKGCDYFKSFSSVLKILEFVCLLISLGCVGYFFQEMHGLKKKDILKFFLFVVIVAYVLVIAFWLTFMIGIHQKITAVNWHLSVGVIFAIWAAFLLVGSALLSDTLKTYEDEHICKNLDVYDKKEQCEQLMAGAVCGFIAMALFIADSVLHFTMEMKSRPTTTTTVA